MANQIVCEGTTTALPLEVLELSRKEAVNLIIALASLLDQTAPPVAADNGLIVRDENAGQWRLVFTLNA